MSLSATSVSELALETTVFDLWAEFLAAWFDGTSHAVGGNTPIVFPAATLRIEQRAAPQPLSGVAITLTWSYLGRDKVVWEMADGKRHQFAYGGVTFLFWIRAATTNRDARSAEAAARQCGENLFAVLQNSAATRELRNKGIHRLYPIMRGMVARGPQGDGHYATRLLTCRGQLRYPVVDDEQKYEPGTPPNERATQGRPTPYDTLGISPSASPKEIKAAYRQRIKEYHPDKVASLGPELRALAEEMTKQINGAYEKLSTSRRRE